MVGQDSTRRSLTESGPGLNPDNEFVGQHISYDAAAGNAVPMVSLDSLGLKRLDLLKLDVEGMELEVLDGGRSVLAKHRPIMLIEVLKSDRAAIEKFLGGFGYRVFPAGHRNIVAVHAADPTLNQITGKNGEPIVAAE